MHVHAFILIKTIKVPIIKQKITIRHYSFKNDDAVTGLIIYTSFESVLYLLYFVKISLTVLKLERTALLY